MHAIGMNAAVVREGYELHAMGARGDDAGQVDLASALTSELDERRGAEFLRHRGIQTDSFAG